MKPTCFALKGIYLNLDTTDFYFCGERITLTAREFQVVATLMSMPGWTFSRAQLRGTKNTTQCDVQNMGSDVKRIRRKLKAVGVKEADPRNIIQTVRGIGYRFNKEWYKEGKAQAVT